MTFEVFKAEKHPFTLEQTQDWWRATVKDEGRLAKFLQKLYRTELGGYTEHLEFMSRVGAVDPRTAQIIMNIALDELKHAHIIRELLEDRKAFDVSTAPASAYWAEVNRHVRTLEQYCAVNHFGEGLAAFRFKVIRDMAETPSDIKRAIETILPDEQFHEVTLQKLAGVPALEQMLHVHNRAVDKIKSFEQFIPPIDHEQLNVYINSRLAATVDTEAEAWAVIGNATFGSCHEVRSAKTGRLLDDFIPW